MSTTASPGNGLNRVSDSPAPGRVVPTGNTHESDAAVAQRLTDRPAGPARRCWTVTPPPSTSTTAAAWGDFTMSLTTTTWRAHGSNRNGVPTGATPSGNTVTVPCRAVSEALVMIRV